MSYTCHPQTSAEGAAQLAGLSNSQAVTTGLATGKQLSCCSHCCPLGPMRCYLSTCWAVLWVQCCGHGAVCRAEYDACTSIPIVLGAHRQCCRAPEPRPGCTLHCVRRQYPGPSGVRPWGIGGAWDTPITGTAQTPPPPDLPPPRSTCVILSRGSCPSMPQPVPLLVQTTEEPSHPGTAYLAQLSLVVQWVPSWGAPAPLIPANREAQQPTGVRSYPVQPLQECDVVLVSIHILLKPCSCCAPTPS